MKTLVVQVSIGISGYIYTNPQATSDFDTHLMPTVKRYCDRFGYDYKLVTEYPQHVDVTWFNYNTKPKDFDYSKTGKNKSTTLVRYLNMYNPEYDRVISLDNDIYIPETAEPLPEVKGHMAVRDLGKSWDDFRSKIKLPQDTFVNAGVQMVDKETGKLLQEYIEKVCKKQTPPIVGYHSDQGYMNYFRSNNPERANLLDYKWNYMAACHKPRKITSQNFVHYAGVEARAYFYEDLKRGLIK